VVKAQSKKLFLNTKVMAHLKAEWNTRPGFATYSYALSLPPGFDPVVQFG
jgi:hypothetical protein